MRIVGLRKLFGHIASSVCLPTSGHLMNAERKELKIILPFHSMYCNFPQPKTPLPGRRILKPPGCRFPNPTSMFVTKMTLIKKQERDASVSNGS
ncbi:hypothetical protein Y032_0266g718 [Ancylostoma ceylanicum]|uniref:Uncharacterized protein n=1 Tax=Ancylostoma ceylanicum TaxID=53326 RepID=A0A016SAE1_9BILA|nr:hypothetical protein Y032_0266g718 [Ancylostoma ceylanicum]